jgi:hypothetical protein
MSSRHRSFLLPVVLGISLLLQFQIRNLFQLGREFKIYASIETQTVQSPPVFRGESLQQARPSQTSDQRPANNNSTAHRKWAYAFLMAGVDVSNPGYRGILYNVLVSAEILKESRADVIVMVQMAHTSSATALTGEEEDLLRQMNVKIHYLDLPAKQNFYSIQYEKFHILDLVEYSRVIFMDGDVMPYCPMDYLFELSDPADGVDGILKENLVLAWSMEPAHGGLFMLEPREGDHQLLLDIITRREAEATKTSAKFDRVRGWGHVITAPDHWHSIGGREGPNATLWKWHGDFADQGLLYYWTKYYKRSVSLVIKDQVENWSSREDQAIMERVIPKGALTPHACLPVEYALHGKYAKSRYNPLYAPLRDFRHFSGRHKPWRLVNKIDWNRTLTFDDVQHTDAQHYWLYMLRQLNERLGLGLDVTNLHVPDAPYGEFPTDKMVRQVVEAKQRRQ